MMNTTELNKWRNKLPKLHEIVKDLDRNLAILGIVAGGIVFLWFAMRGDRTFVESPVFLFLACAIYLAIRKRLSPLTIPFLSKLDLKPHAHLILNILFFSLFSYNVLSPFLDTGDYHRPLGYFISIALMTAILAIEIVSSKERKAHTGFILLKVVLIGLSLRWTPQLIFPDLVGSDPNAYRNYLTVLLETGHNPGQWGYARLPVFPLITGSTMVITDLNYKLSAMFSISFLEVIGSIFVFLIGRLIYNTKVGLLAALLLVIASRNIEMGYWTIAQTLSLFLIPFLIYLIFKAGRQSVILASLYLAISAILIMTHTLGALSMAILLFLFWGGFEFFKRLNREGFSVPAGLSLAIFFGVAMLGWWMYASGHIQTLAQLIKWGFHVARWEVPTINPLYLQQIPYHELLLDRFGLNLFFGFAIIGSLYMLSGKFGNKYSFPLVLGGFALMAVAFFSFPLGISGVQADRWIYFAEVIIAIPVAIGLFLVHGILKNNLAKIVVLTFLVAIISFFSITCPKANLDSPIYSKNTAVRYASTEAELKAGETLGSFSDRSFNWGEKDNLQKLTTGDFSNLEGVVIEIRQQYVTGPFYIGGALISKLDYNPYQRLDGLKFNRIYNSGSVSAFLKEQTKLP